MNRTVLKDCEIKSFGKRRRLDGVGRGRVLDVGLPSKLVSALLAADWARCKGLKIDSGKNAPIRE